MKKANILLCAALFVAVGFSGCVLQIESPAGSDGAADGGSAQGNQTRILGENETGDPKQLAAGNNILYMHAKLGEQLSSNSWRIDSWMNTDEYDAESTMEYCEAYTRGLTDTWWGVYFQLSPAPGEEIDLDENGNIVAAVHATHIYTLGTSLNRKAQASLYLNGDELETIYEENAFQNQVHVFSFNSPDKIEAGATLEFRYVVWVSLDECHSKLYTDGSSTLTLPIISPIYSGASGGGSSNPSSVKSSSSDRNAEIDESATSVSTGSDGKWHAKKTVTITNDFGGASSCGLSLATCNGGIDISSGSASGYTMTASLEGIGGTREEAVRNLNEMDWDHSDSLSAGKLSLDLSITSADWQDKCAIITASVPKSAEYSIESITTNGGIECTGLHGTSFIAETTNGGVACSGNFDNLDIGTTNSGISVQAASAASGTYNLETTNGGITLSLKNTDDYGYDLSADTTNGKVSMDLPGTEPVGEQSDESKHVRTEGYESKKIKVTVAAETTNSNIGVEES